MTELRGQLLAGQAWGGHLALDAIVAYVDEELSSAARRRALEHLSRCSECAAEVIAQTQARLALRASSAPSLPSSLLSSLRAIPTETELPAPPAGLAMSADGQLVSMLRDPGTPRRGPLDRRVKMGAGAVVTGLALGGLMVAGNVAGPSATPTASIGGSTNYVSGSDPRRGVAPITGIGPATGIGQPVLDARLQYGTAPHAVPTSAPTSAPFPAGQPATVQSPVIHHAHG